MMPNNFFRPADAFLRRFSLPGKILLMGLVFLLFITILLVLVVGSELGALRISGGERSGTTAIGQTVEVIRNLQRHRGQRSRLLNGDASARAAVDEARQKVDQAMAAAEAELAATTRTLGLAEEWQQIHAGWQRLRKSESAVPREDFAAHSLLVEKTIALIARISDRSALSLDRDLATHYLVDAAVARLPSLIESAAQARGQAAGIAARRAISLDERISLATKHARYSENLRALAGALESLPSSESSIATGLLAERGAAISAGAAFGESILKEFVQAGAISADPGVVFAAGTRAVDGAFSVWSNVLKALDLTLDRRIADKRLELWALGIVSLLLVGLVAYLFVALRNSVAGAAGDIAVAAGKIAAGDLDTSIPATGADEFGAIATALNGMRESLARQLARERETAVENLRVRNALDRASVSMMLADADGRITYMNESVRALLKSAEPELRKRIPSFAVDTLVGRNFDEFHRNPAHQRGIVGKLTNTHAAQIEVGPYTFLLKANPVIGGDGKRLGTVLEWNDRTGELAVERELSGLIDASIDGDFSRRIAVAGKQGFFKQLAEGLNRLMGIVSDAIDEVGGVLNAMARGDLTATITTDYTGTLGQLKDDANASVQQLREVVGRIQSAADAIETAAQEISAGNTDLSSRTEEQASSLEETASSMEELNATVRQNAENARQANDLAHASNTVAERGGQMMGRVVSTMSSIQESSRKIADIIGVIDSIAFQTNILALNAAVEAARAGEQGRGFAVVASEVRSLAQRSAQAAKEIKGLIDDSVGKVEQGANLVDDAGKTMGEVVTNFQRLAALVTEIAEASKEQSSGIEQVTQAVGQMDEVTQQNAALVEQAAAAAESLQEQASTLVSAVGVFSLDAASSAKAAERNAGQPRANDFEEIIEAHMKWKGRLRRYLSGSGEELDPEVVERDDRCTLGCWIHGDGQRHRHDPLFGQLQETHADFHKCAARVIRLHDRGEGQEAHQVLSDEFLPLADATVRSIRALKSTVGGNDPAVAQDAGEQPTRTVVRPIASPLPKVSRGSSNAAALQDEWEEF